MRDEYLRTAAPAQLPADELPAAELRKHPEGAHIVHPLAPPGPDTAPWIPGPRRGPLSPVDCMRVRTLVNAKIAPACLVDVVRLQERHVYAFLGRWGTFRFDVLVSVDQVATYRSLDELAAHLVHYAGDALENAITTLVTDRHEQLIGPIRTRIRAAHERIEELEAQLADLQQLRDEDHEHILQLAVHVFTPWYRRAYERLEAWLERHLVAPVRAWWAARPW